jgi:anti-sigma factor RsiW
VATAQDDDLACQELVEIINAYLDGALPEGERERFEAHLEICEGCRRYLDQMRTTILVMGRLNEKDLDPSAKDRLVQLFREWNRT